jgi:hypothetical protein
MLRLAITSVSETVAAIELIGHPAYERGEGV